MPQIWLGCSGMMVPSWRLSSTGCGCRWGASRLFSRISRSTRRIEVRHLAHPQPRPDLAVAFAMEGRLVDGAADLSQKLLIAVTSLRATFGGSTRGELAPALLIEGRAPQAPTLRGRPHAFKTRARP